MRVYSEKELRSLIRSRLKKEGITQEVAAAQAGCSVQAFNNQLTGQRTISKRVVRWMLFNIDNRARYRRIDFRTPPDRRGGV